MSSGKKSTTPDHIGHLDFPGCSRCHDGKHLNADSEPIGLQCNLCHAIPQVALPGQPLPVIDLSVKEMPQSHHDSFWLAKQRFRFSVGCGDCHTVSNAGGADNSSFCSNYACHGIDRLTSPSCSPRIVDKPANDYGGLIGEACWGIEFVQLVAIAGLRGQPAGRPTVARSSNLWGPIFIDLR